MAVELLVTVQNMADIGFMDAKSEPSSLLE